MSLAADTDNPFVVLPTRNGPRKFGALTMRDFAKLQAGYMKREATFYELIRWCQSAAGCVAVIAESGAKFDPVYNEDQADADLTPKKMHRACIDILAMSTETEPENESSADPNVEAAATPTG